MARERLQKLIAAAGICSRRRAEELLSSGRISVNGRVAQLGDRADPLQGDAITLDGKLLAADNKPLLLLVNKPMGVLTSCSDPHGRSTVMDLLPSELSRGRGLHPIGRLDADSRGALLLTNQGWLTLRLSHPRYGHHKLYWAWVTGHPSSRTLKRWAAGVPLDGKPSQPVALRVLARRDGATQIELDMKEGKNRQIRRTAAGLGHPVLDLQRVAIGPLHLNALPEGRWRSLDRQEWESLAEHPS